MCNLAPVAICVYSRVHHLRRTIDALKQNYLAEKSELYLFSDGPKPGDEDKVNLLRQYLYTIDGFKKVHILEREINNRVKNCRGGLKKVLNLHGRIIMLEEDIVTAPGFLSYINNALDYYETNLKVVSVSGFAPPLKSLGKNDKDYFTLPRFNGWGVGMWKRSLDMVPDDLSGIDLKRIRKKLNRGGNDIYHMALLDKRGKIDALDVRIMVLMAINNMVSIYPKHSLVQNIGHDGSGVHCGSSAKFDHEALWDKTVNFQFTPDIAPDATLLGENYKFRAVSRVRVLLRNIKYKFFK